MEGWPIYEPPNNPRTVNWHQEGFLSYYQAFSQQPVFATGSSEFIGTEQMSCQQYPNISSQLWPAVDKKQLMSENMGYPVLITHRPQHNAGSNISYPAINISENNAYNGPQAQPIGTSFQSRLEKPLLGDLNGIYTEKEEDLWTYFDPEGSRNTGECSRYSKIADTNISEQGCQGPQLLEKPLSTKKGLQTYSESVKATALQNFSQLPPSDGRRSGERSFRPPANPHPSNRAFSSKEMFPTTGINILGHPSESPSSTTATRVVADLFPQLSGKFGHENEESWLFVDSNDIRYPEGHRSRHGSVASGTRNRFGRQDERRFLTPMERPEATFAGLQSPNQRQFTTGPANPPDVRGRDEKLLPPFSLSRRKLEGEDTEMSEDIEFGFSDPSPWSSFTPTAVTDFKTFLGYNPSGEGGGSNSTHPKVSGAEYSWYERDHFLPGGEDEKTPATASFTTISPKSLTLYPSIPSPQESSELDRNENSEAFGYTGIVNNVSEMTLYDEDMYSVNPGELQLQDQEDNISFTGGARNNRIFSASPMEILDVAGEHRSPTINVSLSPCLSILSFSPPDIPQFSVGGPSIPSQTSTSENSPNLSITIQDPLNASSATSEPTEGSSMSPSPPGSPSEAESNPMKMRRNKASRLAKASRDEQDKDLLKLRAQGMSYKHIKERLGIAEAESTLRGRFRTLTKPKNERLRKPTWTDEDISQLLEAVDPDLPQVRWKQVSETIYAHSGNYRFGSSTCKKQYLILVAEGKAPPLKECMGFGTGRRGRKGTRIIGYGTRKKKMKTAN
ncbi:hypothetical protein RUND412_004395 [Rhizina undulata]